MTKDRAEQHEPHGSAQMTAVIAMHPSRFGAIRSLVSFQDFRLKLSAVHALADEQQKASRYRVHFQPIDQGELLDAQRLAQVARVYGRSAQFDGDVFDSVLQWLSGEDETTEAVVSFSALSLEDELFVPRLIEIAERHQVAPQRLWLELDQTVFHPHEEDVKEGLEAMRQAGFHTGLQRGGGMALELAASGLVDYFTVSRRHVGNMLEDQKRADAVRAMGQMAKIMNVGLIADGVDCYERLGALIDAGVSHACGPLFGDSRLVTVNH